MKSRLIRTFIDFAKLVEMIQPENISDLIADYSVEILDLISSCSDLLAFFAAIDQTTKQIVVQKHTQLILAGLNTAGDFIQLVTQETSLVTQLIPRHATDFSTKIHALFSESANLQDLIRLVSQHTHIAENLFRDSIPHWEKFFEDNDLFSEVKKISPTIALRIYLHAADHFFMTPSKSRLLRLATLFSQLPITLTQNSYNNETQTHLYFHARHEKVDVLPIFNREMGALFGRNNHKTLLSELIQRENFITLYRLNPHFAKFLLKGNDLVKILFGDGMTLSALTAFAKQHPQLALALTELAPNEVDKLFTSTTEYRLFYDTNTSSLLVTKRVSNLFAYSTRLEDWEWLAKITRAVDLAKNTRAVDLAKNALQNANHTIKSYFERHDVVMRFTTLSTKFLVHALKQNDIYRSFMLAFKNHEDFLAYYRASHREYSLHHTHVALLRSHPEFLEPLYHLTNQFRDLPAYIFDNIMPVEQLRNIALSLITTNSSLTHILNIFPQTIRFPSTQINFNILTHLIGAARTASELVRFVGHQSDIFIHTESSTIGSISFLNTEVPTYLQSPQCTLIDALRSCKNPADAFLQIFKTNHFLSHSLMVYQAKNIVPLLDFESLMKLPVITRSKAIERAPDETAELLKNANVDLNMLELFLNLEQSPQQSISNAIAIMTERNITIFQAIYCAADFQQQLAFTQSHPAFMNTLVDHGSIALINIFKGPRLAELAKVNPRLAQMLLEKCKTNLAALLPTREDYLLLDRANHMIMRHFAVKYPACVAKHPHISSEAASTTFLPNLSRNPNRFQPVPNPPKSAFLAEVDDKGNTPTFSAFV